MRYFLLTLSLLASTILTLPAQEGFGEKTTGGKGGKTVTVRDFQSLQHYAENFETVTIYVEGTIKFDVIYVRSNKSIIGKGPNPTLKGNLNLQDVANNVIIQNLTITNPSKSDHQEGDDGITIFGAKRVWIDHCTFYDCGDGCLDMTQDASEVTVSWCKFYYTEQHDHRLTMLLKGLAQPPEKKEKDKEKREKQEKKLSKLKVTLHNNWWATNCFSRMPAAQFVKVHMYNNYFSAKGNDFATEARQGAEIFSENNYYENMRNPIMSQKGGKIRAKGNIYKNCSGTIDKGDDDVFDVPYEYSRASAKKVPDLVKQGAGAR